MAKSANTFMEDMRAVAFDDFKSEFVSKIVEMFPKEQVIKLHKQHSRYVNIIPPTLAFLVQRYTRFSAFTDRIISGLTTELKDEIHRQGEKYLKEEEQMARKQKPKANNNTRCLLREISIDDPAKATEWYRRTGLLSKHDFEALNNLEFVKPEEAKKRIENLLAITDDHDFQMAVKKMIPEPEKKGREAFNIFPEIMKENGLIAKINNIPEPERQYLIDRLSIVSPDDIRGFLKKLNELDDADFVETYKTIAFFHKSLEMFTKEVGTKIIELLKKADIPGWLNAQDQDIDSRIKDPNGGLKSAVKGLKSLREKLQRKL